MGGLLQMEPALIFSDPKKTFIGQQYFLINLLVELIS